MRHRLLLLAALLSSTAIASTPVTWGFEGQAAGLGMPGGQCFALGCQDILNASFSGRITFDLDAVDLDPSPGRGVYQSVGGPYGLHLDIGSYSYDTNYVQTGILASGSSRQYTFLMNQVEPWFTRVGIFAFYAPEAGVITSDAQLAAPPSPWRGGGPDPQFLTTLGGADIDLRVTSMVALPVATPVPEPETYAMWGLGMAGVIFAVRRTRNRP